MQGILDWVKSGLLFGIVGSVFMLLCPNKTYERHISFVVGLLFLLVMIHPVMEWLSVDTATFLHSVENYLSIETNSLKDSENDRKLYENALEIQLMSLIKDAGYPVEDLQVVVDEQGNVTEVTFHINGTITGLDALEQYITNVFGQEVIISYENN